MNRKAKKAMAMGMAALVAVTSVGGNTAEAAVKKLTKKATVTKSLTVKVGKTKKISVKKVPKKTKVTYKTNKKKIATVTKKGVVKGVKKGKAVITVKLKYKKKTITKKCNVTVKKATTTKVTATATPTVPAQVPTATPVAPTATPGTNATATPGANATETPGANATETPGANATETPGTDAPTPTTPGAVTPSVTPSETPSETPTGTETPGKDETEKPDDVTSGGAVTGTVVTTASMTFTQKDETAALMVTSGSSVSVYVVSKDAVVDFYNGDSKEIPYKEIDLKDGSVAEAVAVIDDYTAEDKTVVFDGFTATVTGSKASAKVVVESADCDVQFVGYKQYTKADEEATLVDGENTYVIAYDELYKVYKAEADADVEVSYTKNGADAKETVKAGENEVTIDGITCKAFVDKDEKTADVFVLKRGVVLK